MTMGVALVVGVFCHMLALSHGLRETLTVTVDPRNLLVLAEGATSESNSALSHEEANRLAALPHLSWGTGNRPAVSAEVVVQMSVGRRGDDTGAEAGVAVRGVDLDVASTVRPGVRLTEGRWFQPGADEIVVGRTAAVQFTNSEVGAIVECGDRRMQVVGIFESGGGVHESEFWGHISNVAAAYRRDMYSCAMLRLDSSEEAIMREVIDRIESSSVALRGVPEKTYCMSQLENARLVRDLALLLLILMSIGAIFAAMNAVQAALAGRIREIGMLRAVGFPASAVLSGLIAESTAMALAGGFLGCTAAAVLLEISGNIHDLVGTTTFTSVAFRVHIGVVEVAYSMTVAVMIGLLGGMLPAIHAVRIPVVHALRAV